MFRFINENKNALAFSAFQTVRIFSIQILIPFLSIILMEANWTTSQITIFFALFFLAGFLFSPIIGKISDEIGRKTIIIIGLIFQIVFFLVYYYVSNIYFIYFARFLDGLSFACISVVTLGAFEDIIKERRGFWTGIFLSLGTIGGLLGPILAGFIAQKYKTKYLLIVSILFLIVSIVMLFVIPEVKRKKQQIKLSDFNPLSEIKHFLKHRKLQGMSIIGIVMNSKGEIYTIFFPIFVLETLGYSKEVLGLLISIPTFFHIFQFYYGKLADKISAEFGTLLGVFLVASSIIFLPTVTQFYQLVIILIIYGIGGGIWNVNAWALMGNIAKEENMEGEVIGTYDSLAKLGIFFTILVSAYIIEAFGISRTLQYFAIAIIATNGLVYFFLKPIFYNKTNDCMAYKYQERA